MSESSVRASDAERDADLAELGDAAVTGCLTLDEFHDRTVRALHARTRADLDHLLADLPGNQARLRALVDALVTEAAHLALTRTELLTLVLARSR